MQIPVGTDRFNSKAWEREGQIIGGDLHGNVKTHVDH
jgi:hypothetical protein